MSFREGIRHHDQAAIRLACVYANDGCEFGGVTDGRRDRLHCERLCRGFEGLQPIFGIWRRCGVEQESDPGDARRNLLEQFQPLAGHPGLHNDETSDIAARVRKARDEAAAKRIGHKYENDGDAASSVGGIVSPSTLAVVRLMTRSNLVGCSTGMSPGFVPRRILSTCSAARRYRSGRL